METTTFTLITTQPIENILTFAKSKGYQEQIIQVNEDGTQIEIINSESASNFCAIYFTKLIAEDMSSVRVKNLIEQSYTNQLLQIKEIKDSFIETITVTIE